MSNMARSWRANPSAHVLAVVLAATVLLALTGHLVGDAICRGRPSTGAPPCAARFQLDPSAGQKVSCSWHTGMALAALPIVLAPRLLLVFHPPLRPRAYFAQGAPPVQPPIAHLTA